MRKCNICHSLLKPTGQPIVCPTCGMRYWPYERTTMK